MKLINKIKKINILEIVFFSFFVRFLALLFYPNQFLPDSETYLKIGNAIFSGNIIETPLHMPGYGVWMFIMNFITKNNYGVVIADMIVSSFTVYIIYLLSFEIFKRKDISLLSAFIFALYPFSIFYSINSVSETLYVFTLFSSILLFYRNKFMIGSIILILSIYIKPTSDIFAPFLILIFCLILKKYSFRKTLIHLVTFYSLYCLLLSPWWYHNWIKYDGFVRLNLSAGYHLYSGNNPLNKSGGGIGGIDVHHDWTDDDIKNRGIIFEKKFRNDAVDYIKNNPKDFVNLTIIKFSRFWQFYPYAKEYKKIEYKLISIFSYGIIFVFFILFLIFDSKKYIKKISPLLLIIFLTTLIHSITIASIRYRFPIEPILIIMASYSILKSINYLRLKKFFGARPRT